MAENNDLGNWGEQIACEFLQKKGFIIMDRNWRYGRSHRDLDIVCKTPDQRTYVFVEVKTRSSDTMVLPQEAVDRKKIHFLATAAGHYVVSNGIVEDLRFDIIGVVGTPSSKNVKIEHIENAFNPLLL
ncbi:MAG: YraN family protein [Prevotella sp.]|jgi:putative endonuclease